MNSMIKASGAILTMCRVESIGDTVTITYSSVDWIRTFCQAPREVQETLRGVIALHRGVILVRPLRTERVMHPMIEPPNLSS